MAKIVCDGEYFNVKDTLSCGQVFRFKEDGSGAFLVCTADRIAKCYNDNGSAIIECEDGDEEYFKNYFDLARDYSAIVRRAEDSGYDILKTSAEFGKGVRILNQDKVEMLFSFIVSQNNNIPRIKGIIEKLCALSGELKTGAFGEYRAFPSAKKLAALTEEELKGAGLGYRAAYIKRLAESMDSGAFDVESFSHLSTAELKKSLLSIYGVGEKVADCVSLFGFHRSDAFPVDTWIEKVYREDFKGVLTGRDKITAFFVDTFKEDSGYFQQYLFYYKRSSEK